MSLPVMRRPWAGTTRVSGRTSFAGLSMGNDYAAVPADVFVRSCLFRMPVRVDQGMYAAVACSLLDRPQQRVSIGRKPAIDHERAVFTVHRDHIACTLEEEEAAGT